MIHYDYIKIGRECKLSVEDMACIDRLIWICGEETVKIGAHIEIDCTEMIFVTAGSVRVFCNGYETTLTPEEGMLLFPGYVRGFSIQESQETELFWLRFRGLRALPEEKMILPCLLNFQNDWKLLREICKLIYNILSSMDCTCDIEEYLLQLILCFIRNAHNVNISDLLKPSLAVKAALNYIEETYMNEITLKQIAAKCYLSVSRLSCVMKQTTGFSPMEYVIERRIGDAQQKLMYSDMGIFDIGRSVGYPDLSSFSTAFRKKIGVSPGSFRKMYSTMLRAVKIGK